MFTKILGSISILSLFVFFYFKPNVEKPFIFSESKLKGISFVAPHTQIGDTSFIQIKNINSDWISLMPYAFVPKDDFSVKFQQEKETSKKKHQWWGETPSGVRECIQKAHKQNIKVMIKPHLWLGWGEFTGHMDLKKEEDWNTFEKSFSKYILTFAELANEEKAEMFCIATEMEKHVSARPEYWINLIKEVKKVYSGKITYAENWDSYSKVPFWQELDYIGVDGYFPLSDAKDPSLKELQSGWKEHLKIMEKVANKYQKPILFTEIGYRSCDYSTQKPWETDFSLPENEKLQARAYEALFSQVWNKPWFAGIFIWKWFPIYSKNQKGRNRDSFTPQNKLALQHIFTNFSSN